MDVFTWVLLLYIYPQDPSPIGRNGMKLSAFPSIARYPTFPYMNKELGACNERGDYFPSLFSFPSSYQPIADTEILHIPQRSSRPYIK